MTSRMINPFGVILRDVRIKKFDGSYEMSIRPQVAEFVLYQSIFSPILKGNLAIYDAVNLLNNYPIMGEETIEVTIEQKGTRFVTEEMLVTLNFIVSGVRNIELGATGREQSYIIELHSTEAFQNAKRRVSKAYRTSKVQENFGDIVNNYLKSQKQIRYLGLENSISERVLVVPNLNPLSAITWISKHLSPANLATEHNFIFYETIYESGSRFNFKPLQKQTWRDSVDEGAFSGAENHPFFYISNYENIINSPAGLANLASKGFSEERLILNLNVNKRHSVLEKIVGGYFENELVEIRLDQKDFTTVRSKVTDPWKSIYSNKLQTNTYIQDIINEVEEPETSPHIKYVFFNFSEPEKQDENFKIRWGKYQISKAALAQIDLSVDIHTNMQVVPGDLIYLTIPELHGFNSVDEDKYINGHYMITENKMTIRSSGETTMLLRVNKDSYFTSIIPENRLGLE